MGGWQGENPLLLRDTLSETTGFSQGVAQQEKPARPKWGVYRYFSVISLFQPFLAILVLLR